MASGQGVGPWQISEVDPYLINEVFRQIEQQINLLRGLGGLPSVPTGGGTSTSIILGKHSHETDATGGQISHDTALTGVSVDDHHAKLHTHDGDGSGDLSIDVIGGNYDDANASSTRILDEVIAGANISITESSESGAAVITTSGFSGTVTPVVSITVVNGIVTAAS